MTIPFHLSIYLFIYQSIYLSTYLFIHPYILSIDSIYLLCRSTMSIFRGRYRLLPDCLTHKNNTQTVLSSKPLHMHKYITTNFHFQIPFNVQKNKWLVGSVAKRLGFVELLFAATDSRSPTKLELLVEAKGLKRGTRRKTKEYKRLKSYNTYTELVMLNYTRMYVCMYIPTVCVCVVMCITGKIILSITAQY